MPNLKVRDAGAGHDFYVDFLGLEKQFDLGWVASFRSPDNRAIEVSLVSGDASAPEDSAISVNVDETSRAEVHDDVRDVSIAQAERLTRASPLSVRSIALGACADLT